MFCNETGKNLLPMLVWSYNKNKIITEYNSYNTSKVIIPGNLLHWTNILQKWKYKLNVILIFSLISDQLWDKMEQGI